MAMLRKEEDAEPFMMSTRNEDLPPCLSEDTYYAAESSSLFCKASPHAVAVVAVQW